MLSSTSFVVLVVLLATTISAATVVQTAPLRVACRFAQSPFNFHPRAGTADDPTKCQGMLAEVFYLMMARSKLSYNMTFISTNSLDGLMRLNPATNQSTYDMVVTFHTVTPARLQLHTFMPTIFQSVDQAVLKPSYKKPVPTLVDSVIRTSVLYILLVMGLLMGCMGVIIYIFEHFAEDSDMLTQPPWRRPLWALEMGLETLLTSSTSSLVSHPVTRLCRTMFAIFGIFMMGILGGTLTSQLTTSGVADQSVGVESLRGAKLKVASATLQAYLESLRVGATTTVEADMFSFAQRFYAGQEPDWDGFVSSRLIVQYIDNTFRPTAYDSSITLSNTYTAAGTAELKSFPVSFSVPQPIVSLLGNALQSIRDDGNFTALLNKWVPPDVVDPDADDLAIDKDAFQALYIILGIVFGVLLAVSVALYVWDRMRRNDGNPREVFTNSPPPPTQQPNGLPVDPYHEADTALPFRFREKQVAVARGSHWESMLDMTLQRIYDDSVARRSKDE